MATKQQVIEDMKKVLDWNARSYARHSDEIFKEQIASDFRKEANAFNTLLSYMFKRKNFNDMFHANIEQYIYIRKCEDENWEYWK